MTNIYTECKEIAQEALTECNGDYDDAMEYIRQTCDGHEVSIYYGKAIEFCAKNETSDGEDYLEETDGSVAQDGDTFGSIACRIAFATLLVKSQEALYELKEEAGS